MNSTQTDKEKVLANGRESSVERYTTSNSSRTGTRRYRKYTSKPIQRRNTTQLPTYVPSYSQRSKSESCDDGVISQQSLSLRGSTRNVILRQDTPYSFLDEIRAKYKNRETYPAVPVKEKVALMESWNQGPKTIKPRQPAKRSTSNSSPTKVNAQQKKVQFRERDKELNDPVHPVTKDNKRRNMKLSRDAKHRRSMSDPNLHKSFQAMKQLWDKKVEQDPKSPPQVKQYKSRGNSESSNDSCEITNKKTLKERLSSSKEGNLNVQQSNTERRGPTTPTKPKFMQQDKKENIRVVTRKKSHSTADQTASSLVKNRAKMFDSVGGSQTSPVLTKTSLSRSKPRSSSGESLNKSNQDDSGDDTHDNGRLSTRNWRSNIEKSPARKTGNNNKRNQVEELKSDLARLLDYEETIEKTDFESEDAVVSTMRRNSAQLARERRRNSRRGSNQSDSDSTNSAASSLSSTTSGDAPHTRKVISKEENISPGNKSPVIKSYLHRNAATKPHSTPGSPSAAYRINAHDDRRDSTGCRASSSSLSTPASAPRRKSSLHREHNSSPPTISPVSDFDISPTEVLHRKLSLDAAKRASLSADSGTGTSSPGIRNSISSNKSAGNRESVASAPEAFKRAGSFSSTSSSSRAPPLPPPSADKPTTRLRSASSSPLPIKPTCPPPPPPSGHKNSRPSSLVSSQGPSESISSTPTISSRQSLMSHTAEEEINRILNEISTPTNTRRSFRYQSDSPSPEEETTTSSLEIESSPSGNSNRDSLEVPARHKLRTSDNEDWSDISDLDEEGNQVPTTPSHVYEKINSPEPTTTKEPLEVKLHNIAKELLTTEITYVERLHLIDQIFHKRVTEAVNKKQISSDVKTIFSNVSAIYQFHNEYLLPQLKQRLEIWEVNQRLGDIMTQAAPFLKMYSLYVQNFDEAMNLVKTFSEKSKEFATIIKNIQTMPECHNLSLQHHMLGPVQRIPRYKMLLEDYLKRLPEDSPDRSEAAKALELISIAATHSNETMKQSDKFHKLLNVYNNLVDINFDIVDVSRELMKEGKIIKISARNGEKHERYLYLFNDMLLCCTPLRRLQRKAYRITAKIDLDGMEITEVNNMTISNTFCVNGTKKSMEFATNTPEEKDKWVNAINDAIDNFLERKTSFMKSGSQKKKKLSTNDDQPPTSPARILEPRHSIGPASPLHSPVQSPMQFDEVDTGDEKRIEITCTSGNQYVVDIEDHDLGKRAPRWIKDNEVTMCMHCSKAFNRLLRRRHHCRACGRVICTECSEHKLELQYEKSKTQKVCNKCYAILTGRKQEAESDKKGVLEIEANIVSEKSIISEYLYFMETDKKKAWTKKWCVIPKDEPCLYVYSAHQDVRAIMTMPLPGFTVTEDPSLDREFSFKLIQARKVFLFAASSIEQKTRWEYVFKKAGLGEDLDRDDVYRLGKSKEEQDQETPGGKTEMNGMRLSSSSTESSNASSESSRPSSIMDRNDSYTNINGIPKTSSAVLTESVTSE